MTNDIINEASLNETLIGNNRRAKLRRDQMTLPFSEALGDLKANLAMMGIVCEALVNNVRSRQSQRSPIVGEKLSRIPAPDSVPVYAENMGIREDMDIRIFVEHSGVVGSTYILGSVVKNPAGQSSIVPYSVSKVDYFENEFVFNDGVNEHRFIASSPETARQLWEAQVPERQRSVDTSVSVNRLRKPHADPSGPFVVECVSGHTHRVGTIAQAIEILANKNEGYKVTNANGSTIFKGQDRKAERVSLSPLAIMEAKRNGLSIIHVESTLGDQVEAYIGSLTGRLQEGSIINFRSNNNRPMIGEVLEAGSAFAIVRATPVEEAHVDVVRRSREVSVVYEKADVHQQPKRITEAIVNHRVVTPDGTGGTIVESVLDEGGCPKIPNYRCRMPFDKLVECFVRLDDGSLKVFPINDLYSI